MFKVNDIIKVIHGRRGDRYKVISVFPTGEITLRKANLTERGMNFTANNSDNLELDNTYYRRQKLEKICSRLTT